MVGDQTEIYLLATEPDIDMESSIVHVEPVYYSYGRLEFRPDNYSLPLLQIKQESRQDLHALTEPSTKVLNVEGNILINQNTADQENNVTTKVLTKTTTSHVIDKTELFNTEKGYIKSVTEIPEKTQKIQTYVHISDRVVIPRAIAVLPPALKLRRNIVSPRRLLPPHVRFGPIQGVKHCLSYLKAKQLILMAATNRTPVFLLKMDDNSVTHIDVTDKDKSNWFSLLHLGDSDTSNVWIYEENNELYGITTECIPPHKPLMLGYSKTYADTYSLPQGQPMLDITESSVKTNNWWCYECRRTMASSLSLQRHISVYHKDDYIHTRKRYRCRLCTRTFSRLYTLKRHMARYCVKKAENTENKITTESMPGISLNTSQSMSLNTSQSTDDNRIPSDESFQNYSNSLDFSTNLFDDRMPGFDITGNSRSECDFNLYDTVVREENVLATDLELTTRLDYPQTNKTDEEQSPVEELSSDSRQSTTKEKTSQSALSRQSKLESNRIVTKKKTSAESIKTVHINDIELKQSNMSSDSKYKCEECQLNFNRRGMLVNHLWRVHEKKPISVPLEKPVRHYPCVACNKIYRAAAKRDKHVRVHHPGAEILKAQSIEGGLRAYEPAACIACPREYATRAKLLQHVRQHHPHLAVPAVKGSLKVKS